MNNRERMSIQRPGNRMVIIRRPYSLFSHLMDEFFDEMLSPGLSEEGYLAAPKMDLVDKDSHFILHAEIPGIDKKDIEIELNEEAVVIKGEKKLSAEHKEGKYCYRERSFGKFLRHVPLPKKVKTDQAKASYENGMLKLELPKAEASKSRRIELE